MQTQTLQAIILRRHDVGDADRIFSLLTDELGRLSVMVKGARKPKSKLSGGMLSFSIIECTVFSGKSDLLKLRSARLLQPLTTVQADYELSVKVQELIQDVAAGVPEKESSRELFGFLKQSLQVIDLSKDDFSVAASWALLKKMFLFGNLFDLRNDEFGDPLREELRYRVNVEAGSLTPDEQGEIDAQVIKMWRLAATNELDVVMGVSGIRLLASNTYPLLQRFARFYAD